MRHDEEFMQMDCVKWMRYQHPHEAQLLHHSPNGGRRDAREAARFKAMGTSAGFPDLILPLPVGDWSGLALELKSAKGRQTPEQKAWMERLRGAGWHYAIVRSFDEFRAEVDAYLGTIHCPPQFIKK